MPRSGVRNRANKGIDFPLYHTFAALPTSRDRIKGLFSYLCDYITFWGDSSILVFASFGIFVKLLTICSIPFERRAFFRLLRRRFVGFRRADRRQRTLGRLHALIRLQDKHARCVDEHPLTVGRRKALTRRSKSYLLSLRPAPVTALVKLVVNADSPTRNTPRSSNAS